VRTVSLPAVQTPYSASLLSQNGILLQANCKDVSGTATASVTIGNVSGGDIRVSSGSGSVVHTIPTNQGLNLLQTGQATYTAIGPLGPLTAIVMSVIVPGVGCEFSVAH